MTFAAFVSLPYADPQACYILIDNLRHDLGRCYHYTGAGHLEVFHSLDRGRRIFLPDNSSVARIGCYAYHRPYRHVAGEDVPLRLLAAEHPYPHPFGVP